MFKIMFEIFLKETNELIRQDIKKKICQLLVKGLLNFNFKCNENGFFIASSYMKYTFFSKPCSFCLTMLNLPSKLNIGKKEKVFLSKKEFQV